MNIEYWGILLGANWTIKVLNLIEDDENHVLRYLQRINLPLSFDVLNTVVKSDCIRIALLKKYGGVWMDPSVTLFKHLDDVCWNAITLEHDFLVGFVYHSMGTEHLDWNDYFENWFICALKNNAFVVRWKDVFNRYWNDRNTSKEIWKNPLFEHIDLNNFFTDGGWDLRDYLTQHIAFRKVIEDYPDMREIWRSRMTFYEAGETAFYITRDYGWDAETYYKSLYETKNETLANEILKSPLMKITGRSSSKLRTLSKEQIQNCNCTLSLMYDHIKSTSKKIKG